MPRTLTLHTFPERLQSHKHCLIRLHRELYWFGGRGRDGRHEQTCIILDVRHEKCDVPHPCAYQTTVLHADCGATVDALLLIDGAPQWVWITESYVEFL